MMRVGWLGAGHIATFHSKMLRAARLDDVVWGGVYDVDPTRAETFARASGATPRPSEDAVLDDADAVFICTWTSEHLRLVTKAVERGLPVFCEKPLATSVEDARRMADLAEEAGITNQVGLILRRSPAFAVLRDLVHDEAAGRLMSVVFRDDQWIPVPGAYGSTWRGEVDKAGAGTLIEHSIHDLDIIESAIGAVSAVSARTSYFHGIGGIEDLTVASLDLGGGSFGSLTSVWHDIEARGSLRRVEVFCERRYVALEGDWFGPVRWTDADGADGLLESDALVARAGELGVTGFPQEAFVTAAREHRAVTPDFRDAVRAHEVADAVYRSAAEGGIWVAV